MMSSVSSSETGFRAASTSAKYLRNSFAISSFRSCETVTGSKVMDVDRFIFLNAASEKRFDSGLLVGREIFGIADHAIEPDYIMTDCIPMIAGVPKHPARRE